MTKTLSNQFISQLWSFPFHDPDSLIFLFQFISLHINHFPLSWFTYGFLKHNYLHIFYYRAVAPNISNMRAPFLLWKLQVRGILLVNINWENINWQKTIKNSANALSNFYFLQNNHIYTFKNKEGNTHIKAYYLVLRKFTSLWILAHSSSPWMSMSHRVGATKLAHVCPLHFLEMKSSHDTLFLGKEQQSAKYCSSWQVISPRADRIHT